MGFCLVSGLLPEHACICVGVWVVALDLTVSELLPGVWVGVCFVGSCCLGCGMWDLVAWCLRCGIACCCHAVSAVSCYLPYLVICDTRTLAHSVCFVTCRTCVLVHACSYMRARTCVLVHPCMHRPCLHASMLVCAYMHSCTHVCVHSRCVLLRSTAAWVRALTRVLCSAA